MAASVRRGVRIIEVGRYNNNRGAGIIGGGRLLGEIENSRFLRETSIFDIFL